jgi:hypothetical protein
MTERELSYEREAEDKFLEDSEGLDLLSTRYPSIRELAEFMDVREDDLVTICMASRFRCADPQDDPHLARGVAEELRSIADDLETTAAELAEERVEQ